MSLPDSEAFREADYAAPFEPLTPLDLRVSPQAIHRGEPDQTYGASQSSPRGEHRYGDPSAHQPNWHHPSAREELLDFLADKPPVKAIQIILILDNAKAGCDPTQVYHVELREQTLTAELLESLNLQYQSPNDLEGIIHFDDGSWAQHHQGCWSYHPINGQS